MFNKKLSFFWIIIAGIGFADATYLTVSHYTGDIACSVIKGCDVVLSSSYSTIGPVPVALLGVGYYLLMLLGMVFVLDRKNEMILRTISYISIIGFMFSLWLLYLQSQIINAFCQFCLLSALSSTILFVLGMITLKRYKRQSAVVDDSAHLHN